MTQDIYSTLRGAGYRRSSDDKWFGGVASGLATRLDVDPLVVRAGFVLAAMLGGVGVAAYLLAWLLVPDAGGRILLEEAVHGDGWGVALLALTVMAFLGTFVGGQSQHGWGWLVLVGVGAWWFLRGRGRGTVLGPQNPGPYAAQGPAYPATTAPAAVATDDAGVAGDPAHLGMDPVLPAEPPVGGGPGLPPRPPVPPRPPRSRYRRPGRGVGVATLGLALVAGGIGILVERAGTFGDGRAYLPFAFALGATALVTLVLGLVGRRGGFAAFLTVVLAGMTALSMTIPGARSWSGFAGGGIGSRYWTPTATTTDPTAYRLSVGEAVLDLTELPSTGADRTITVDAGLGDVRVIVPGDLAVTIDPQVGAGSLHTIRADGSSSDVSVPDNRPSVYSHGTSGSRVTVTVRLGLGDLTIEEQS